MREQQHETRARKAKLAISFITVGTLLVVWSLIWLLYLTVPGDVSGAVYLASGVVLSGIAVVIIGLRVGKIGKDANEDDEALKDGPRAHTPATRKSRATRKTDPSVGTA